MACSLEYLSLDSSHCLDLVQHHRDSMDVAVDFELDFGHLVAALVTVAFVDLAVAVAVAAVVAVAFAFGESFAA